LPERSSAARSRRRSAQVATWLSYERWPRWLNAAPCLSLPYTSVSLESRSSVTGPDAVRPSSRASAAAPDAPQQLRTVLRSVLDSAIAPAELESCQEDEHAAD
jgi:hypothetical protein